MLLRPVVRVAFQGELGAFGHAAVKLVADASEPLPVPTFVGVIDAVREGAASHGVLPLENAIAGPVHDSLAALRSADDAIVVGEVTVPVRLCLVAPGGATIDELREVHSQDIALAQCRGYFASRPHITPRAAHDTAGAARYVAHRNDPRVAAVASAHAAAQYDLQVLAAGIEDRPGNYTRFAVIVRRTAPAA